MHFIFNNFFSRKSCLFKIIWKYTVKPDRQQKTIWRIRIAGWIPKATNTSAEYVMRIASLLQQWLHVRASTLSYVHCLPSEIPDRFGQAPKVCFLFSTCHDTIKSSLKWIPLNFITGLCYITGTMHEQNIQSCFHGNQIPLFNIDV